MIRFARALGFVLDVCLGLVLSALFGMVISGVPLTREAAEGADVAAGFKGIERLLMVAIGLTLIRMLHSFFLLAKDNEYDDAMWRLGWHRSGIVAMQLVAQVGVVGGCVAMLVVVKPGSFWLSCWGLFLWPVLLLWDIPAWVRLRDVNVRQVSVHLNRLEGAFGVWVILDGAVTLVFLVILAAWGLISYSPYVERLAERWDKATVLWTIEAITVIVLILAMLIDYMVNSWFYAHVPGGRNRGTNGGE